MKIRVTQPQDAQALHEIMAASFDADQLDARSIVDPLLTPEAIHAVIATTPMENFALLLLDAMPVGYTHVNWWEEADGTFVFNHRGRVHPAYRGRGTGQMLLNWAQQRCLALAHRHCNTGRAVYATWVAETESSAVRLLERAGYGVAFRHVEMCHHAPAPASQPLPTGLNIIPMTPDHHLAIWKTMLAAYPAYVPGQAVRTADDFDAFLLEAQQDNGLWQTAWNGTPGAGGDVAGTLWARVRDDGMGYIHQIAVPPTYQRQGVAAALITRLLNVIAVPQTRAQIPQEQMKLLAQNGFKTAQTFAYYRKLIDFANV